MNTLRSIPASSSKAMIGYVLPRLLVPEGVSLLRIPQRNHTPPHYMIPKKIRFPTTFENVIFPPGEGDDWLLPMMPKVPAVAAEHPDLELKTTKRHIEARGPELLFTDLIHKQYGVVALKGGLLRWEHFNMMHEIVNRNIKKKKNRFAVWRVEGPWLPKTKRSVGKTMGGGKSSTHHYVTPVRAGRIILEAGGYMTEKQAQAFLDHVADQLPFDAAFVTQQELEEQKEELERLESQNTNKFSWDFVMRWNMQNCSHWLSKYDYAWKGKY